MGFVRVASHALLAGKPAVAAGSHLHLANYGGGAVFREADRARREFQRQQRVTACQTSVLAWPGSYASQADFLRAEQACTSIP